MRARTLRAASLILLAGPAVLAFSSGGYFDEGRAWAGLVAWALVVVAVAAGRPLPPGGRGALVAILGLALLTGWTLLSITWAPIAGNAYHAGQLAMLYLGTLLAATMLLAESGVRRWVEPALALGALVVICYGISERLLPGLLHFHRSVSAQGRLEQPLTYWNAMGELAALGFVLVTRIAGDGSRPLLVRSLATGAAVPLGLGLYLSFSRGALFACAAGLVALIVLARTREQLIAVFRCVVAAAAVSLAVSPLHGVTALLGSKALRERQGAIALAALVAIAIAAVLIERFAARRVPQGDLHLPRGASLMAVALICAGLGAAIVIGAKERSGVPLSGGAGRLVSVESNRYAYWRVALRAFAAEPVHGVGAGGWSVWWLRYRQVNDFAQDAHSLPLQTMAELGVVGLALLAAFLAGIGFATYAAHRKLAALAAGPGAGFVVWLAHAPLDWDWQMPAVTLVAIILAGDLLAQSGAVASYSASAIRGASRLKTQTAVTHTSA